MSPGAAQSRTGSGNELVRAAVRKGIPVAISRTGLAFFDGFRSERRSAKRTNHELRIANSKRSLPPVPQSELVIRTSSGLLRRLRRAHRRPLRPAARPILSRGLPIELKREDWDNAARRVSSSLSELELTLGAVAGAVGDAEQSLTYADRRGDADWPIHTRVRFADALHQAGRSDDALARIREAEQMQAKSQPECPLLYSLRGFRYCDLLLTEAERAAWQTILECRGRPHSATCLLPRRLPTRDADALVQQHRNYAT
jgi:hypothetical protein